MQSDANILIAEDENIIAKDISNTLARLGYKVLGSVRTGRDIVKKAAELNPDLILMDIMLEGEMSGIEAAQQIITDFNIPVIYLTALADDETLHKAKVTDAFGYILKPFDERTLHSTIEMAIYKHKINTELVMRTKELEEEREKSDQLLHNIFPAGLIDELKETGGIAPRAYGAVTMLFTDFQGFTSISSGMPAKELVSELNDIFNNFDVILDRFGLEKLKTMGDSYMVGGGFPIETGDHALKVVAAALEMQNYLKKRNKESSYNWKMRAGVHSGDVVAGVVGKNKFTYDVWGNTVNLASIMERESEPGKVNITADTYELVKEYFDCDYRGELDVVGNGLVKMYFVRRLTEKGIMSLSGLPEI